MTITASTPMRSIGDLPRSVWAAKLAGSPMESEIDAIMQAAAPYGALCLCQAIRESSLGQDASARSNHNAWGIMSSVWGILKHFNTWADGAAFFKGILADESIYPPHDITMLDFVRTYVGGPQCRTSGGKTCADPNAAGPNPKYLVSLLKDLNLLTNVTPIPDPKPKPDPTPDPEPKPKPPKDVDPISVIVGGKPYTIISGFKDWTNLPYYAYFEGHGGHANEHTGIDVGGDLGQTLYTPLDGVVTCAGTGNGPGSWKTGCAAFEDKFGNGAGRVEIQFASGLSMILGHCSDALVSPGQKVKAGQAVSRMGGMNSYHTHLETRIWTNGDYLIIEPIAALKQAMNGVVPVVYAERAPLPQPSEWDVSVQAFATKAGVPVLQHADLTSAPVRWPLEQDEEFDVIAVVLGDDLNWYWISSLGSRIPVEGTRSPNGPKVPA